MDFIFKVQIKDESTKLRAEEAIVHKIGNLQSQISTLQYAFEMDQILANTLLFELQMMERENAALKEQISRGEVFSANSSHSVCSSVSTRRSLSDPFSPHMPVPVAPAVEVDEIVSAISEDFCLGKEVEN